jgi:NAD(P) transhydrogenase
MSDHFDLVVIGGGPAGQSAAELAAFYGRGVLLVQDGPPGGAVTTTGGVPTKTLREVARHVRDVGRDAVPPEHALQATATRTAAVCAAVQRATACEIDAAGVPSVRGRARLVDAHTARIGERTVTARAIVIATGSRPRRLPFDDPDVYDSDGVLGMREVPRDVVVVGAGAVGIEYATIFAALGVGVTVVDREDRPLPGMDEELVDRLVAESRGITFVHRATVDDVARDGARLAVTLSTGARVPADAVLVAAGRAPATDGLGLDDVGVRRGERGGIAVDAYFRTSVDGVYAVGDVVAPTLASTAAQQGRAAACHALGLVFGVAVDRAAATAVYGLPEIAGVGATERELAERHVPYLAGRCELAGTARGAIAGTGGLLKVLFRPDDRKLLGVHCLGDVAAEIVGLGQIGLQLDAALDVFLTTALATPTYGAAYHAAAVDGIGRLARLQEGLAQR